MMLRSPWKATKSIKRWIAEHPDYDWARPISVPVGYLLDPDEIDKVRKELDGYCVVFRPASSLYKVTFKACENYGYIWVIRI